VPESIGAPSVRRAELELAGARSASEVADRGSTRERAPFTCGAVNEEES
jgi:hypothetical protein